MASQYADLSIAVRNRRCIIKCNGYDEMMLFKENVLEQFPEYYKKFPFDYVWEHTVLRHESRYKNSVCFGFDIGLNGDPSSSYCDESWYVSHGFTIIELSSLIESVEISEANTDINLLFG